MPLFITVENGPRADRAKPILAVADQRLVGAMLRALVIHLPSPADTPEAASTPTQAVCDEATYARD
jgi:hypothetical protein